MKNYFGILSCITMITMYGMECPTKEIIDQFLQEEAKLLLEIWQQEHNFSEEQWISIYKSEFKRQ